MQAVGRDPRRQLANFHSSTCRWLVVTAGEARYSGTGTIEGSGEYGYSVTAVDAALSRSRKEDTLHLRIWIGDDTRPIPAGSAVSLLPRGNGGFSGSPDR